MKQEIFKVQIAIAGEPAALAYNKDQSAIGQFPPEDILLKLMEGKAKKFFYGRVDDSGKIQLIKEAPWQEW